MIGQVFKYEYRYPLNQFNNDDTHSSNNCWNYILLGYLLPAWCLSWLSVYTNPLDSGDKLTRSWTAIPGMVPAVFLLLTTGIFLGEVLVLTILFLSLSVHILRENLPLQKVEA